MFYDMTAPEKQALLKKVYVNYMKYLDLRQDHLCDGDVYSDFIPCTDTEARKATRKFFGNDPSKYSDTAMQMGHEYVNKDVGWYSPDDDNTNLWDLDRIRNYFIESFSKKFWDIEDWPKEGSTASPSMAPSAGDPDSGGGNDSTDCPCECHDPEEPEMVDWAGKYFMSSPIILDLDGDGVETVSVEDGVYFDHDDNRFAEKTGWAGSDDALLVWDGNGNGQIDDGSEMFGNNSVLSNGEKAANGFEALSEFDSNNDGIVNADDERWSELKLWQDKNGDGIVDDGEMLTMEEAGVAGLNVDYTNQNITDENGNEHRQSGSFIREDGTIAQMTDVWFDSDLIDTQFMDEINVSEAIAQLPNLRGYGNIPSLHQ